MGGCGMAVGLEQDNLINLLYGRPIHSTRVGPLFNAHSYPTKINPCAIVPFILAHTKPGDVVFDGFAGSGATGIAAALCDRPDPELRANVEARLGCVEWGPRTAVLYDISEVATVIARNLLYPPDPEAFREAATRLLSRVEAEWGWLYSATDDQGRQGTIRHSIWTDYVVCPSCEHPSAFWDLAVSTRPLSIVSAGKCPKCGTEIELGRAQRAMESFRDDLLNEDASRRLRTLACVYGRTERRLWKRPPNRMDFESLRRVDHTAIPSSVPVVPMLGRHSPRWGELHRSGYHKGLTHVHHFYTRRNLIAVAAAWQEIEDSPKDIQEALRFWISSYNASHATLMTRVVCKKGNNEFVVTSAQPGALYISSLPVEKNVFNGLRAKLKTIISAFRAFRGGATGVAISCASSLGVAMPSSSVDYIFTDPPFGDNIQYAEVNFISEAWLGRVTNASEEVIVSAHQAKSVRQYQLLLTQALAEAWRVLKPGGFATLAFHSATPAIWAALLASWEAAGFDLVRISILDKTQGSFKQVTTEGAVRGDCLILLQKPSAGNAQRELRFVTARSDTAGEVWTFVANRLRGLPEDSTERTRERLYGRFIGYCLERGNPVSADARTFYAGLAERFERRGDHFFAEL
jgi:DNA methylase